MSDERPRKQVVYGLWLIEFSQFGKPYGRWLEWNDVRLGGEEWDPHLGSWSHHMYVFASHRAELVKVLKYMRGEGLPKHVKDECTENCTANYLPPDNTDKIVIRKVQLPAPM